MQTIRQKIAKAQEELRRMDEYLARIEGNLDPLPNPDPSSRTHPCPRPPSRPTATPKPSPSPSLRSYQSTTKPKESTTTYAIRPKIPPTPISNSPNSKMATCLQHLESPKVRWEHGPSSIHHELQGSRRGNRWRQGHNGQVIRHYS